MRSRWLTFSQSLSPLLSLSSSEESFPVVPNSLLSGGANSASGKELLQQFQFQDQFSVRKDMVRINWGAYPHYQAPEAFAPFILDGKHLYYINAFENAASTMETSAVAAENVARLIFTRFFSKKPLISSNLKNPASAEVDLHLDL